MGHRYISPSILLYTHTVQYTVCIVSYSTNNILSHLHLKQLISSILNLRYETLPLSPPLSLPLSLSSSLAVPPSFTDNGRLSNTLGFARESLTLRCNATGAPSPTYQWMKEDTSLSTTNPDFRFPSPGVLVFQSLNSALQGNYTCLAISMIGAETLIGTVNSTAQVYVAGKGFNYYVHVL